MVVMDINLNKDNFKIPIFYAPDNKAAILALVSMLSILKNTKHKINFLF